MPRVTVGERLVIGGAGLFALSTLWPWWRRVQGSTQIGSRTAWQRDPEWATVALALVAVCVGLLLAWRIGHVPRDDRRAVLLLRVVAASALAVVVIKTVLLVDSLTFRYRYARGWGLFVALHALGAMVLGTSRLAADRRAATE